MKFLTNQIHKYETLKKKMSTHLPNVSGIASLVVAGVKEMTPVLSLVNFPRL